MTSAATVERWRRAQGAELSFWKEMALHELVASCAEKLEFWSQFDDRQIDGLLADKNVLEIGCGPLGLSVVSFSGRGDAVRRLVKTDPLPPLKIRETRLNLQRWAKTFFDWLEPLAAQGDYMRVSGEELPFDGSFDTVVTYNVLDHVRAPQTILQNAHRALRPGGTLVVGVDCLSMLGRIRFEWITRRVAEGSILVDAHPHTFLPGQVAAMIRAAGFELTNVHGLPGRVRRLLGHHYRPAFVATK